MAITQAKMIVEADAANGHIKLKILAANATGLPESNEIVDITRVDLTTGQTLTIFVAQPITVPSLQLTEVWQGVDRYVEPGTPYEYSVSFFEEDSSYRPIDLDTQDICVTDGGFINGIYSSPVRQLKVLYDLDIASYKYNIIDTVTPTLGSAYPFIRRSGTQKYRSFNLSGLISYHQEEEVTAGLYSENFKSEFSTAYSRAAHSLAPADYDRIQERQYREAVIDFLQDGTVKVLRTLEEGNIFVRLTNVTLTPKKELGRLIYSFSCTAVECMEASQANYEIYCYNTMQKG